MFQNKPRFTGFNRYGRGWMRLSQVYWVNGSFQISTQCLSPTVSCGMGM